MTNNPEDMEDHFRFRDSKNNFPIIVPPTTGDRIDFIPRDDYQTVPGYSYRIEGWLIMIRGGEIREIIESK